MGLIKMEATGPINIQATGLRMEGMDLISGLVTAPIKVPAEVTARLMLEVTALLLLEVTALLLLLEVTAMLRQGVTAMILLEVTVTPMEEHTVTPTLEVMGQSMVMAMEDTMDPQIPAIRFVI